MAVSIFQLTTEELWAEYLITRSERIRDELIKRYMPFGSQVAGQVSNSVDTNICPLDDLQEAAWMAIIKCVEKFDPEFGYSEDIDRRFTGYARKRVHCACIDEFRLHCWINPRTKAARNHGIVPSYFSQIEKHTNDDKTDFQPVIDGEDMDMVDVSNLSYSFLIEECKLNNDEMFIFTSVFVHGLTHEQIGEQIGVQATGVYNRKMKAIEKIRQYYKRQKTERLCAL